MRDNYSQLVPKYVRKESKSPVSITELPSKSPGHTVSQVLQEPSSTVAVESYSGAAGYVQPAQEVYSQLSSSRVAVES